MKFGAPRIGLAVMSLTLTLSDRPSATSDIVRSVRLQAADSIKVLLSEVLFAPRTVDTSFVELANVGTSAVDLSDFILRVDTVEVPLPPLSAPFAAGTRVLIRFNGPAPTEATVVHAAADLALKADGGSVALLSNKNRVLDRVAWGNFVDAIMPLSGGRPRARVDSGSSFGRPPGAYDPGAPTEWVIYPPEQVTPGRPNPLPAVFQLLPPSGAILQTNPVPLSWYTVPGAVRYRVQVARDTTFATLTFDQTVGAPQVSTGQLPLGVYWWRVQAIPADGLPAAWSRPSRIELEARPPGGGGGQDSGADDDAEMPEASGGPSAPAAKPVVLAVPMIYQHKDSPMLLLESKQSGGPHTRTQLPQNPHAWDRDHGDLDKRDPADFANCGLASLAMINRFYGGDLTQDRIGYEVYGPNAPKYEAMIPPGLMVPGPALHERAPGPERDLNYAYGLWDREIVGAGFFVFGAAPGPGSGYGPGPRFETLPTLWNTIVHEIDAGRPVAGILPGHVIVIRGYEIRDGRRLIWLNDPWFGQYIMDFELGATGVKGTVEGIYTWPSHPAIGHLEPESKRDSDGDGVYDFDEINRFHTNPNKTDTDDDGVPDYQDIESGVYESEFRLGYAWNPAYGSAGRDFDGDGKPTELDPDSDDGGCKDGDENASHSGFRENSETSNFNQADDMCGTLRGSVNYEVDVVSTDPIQVIKKIHDEGVILVRLKPESPGSEHYIDDSSTFNYNGFARVEAGDASCKLVGRESASGGGLISKSDGEIGGTRGNDGTMSLGAGAQVKGHSSASGCGLGGSSEIFRGMSWPACDGKLAPANSKAAVKGMLTYEFNCSTLTPPPGFRVLHYHARGFIRVQPPP